MDVTEMAIASGKRSGARAKKRPRSAVTSGRRLFVDGDPNSAWARRFHDLVGNHAANLGGIDVLSSAQLSLIRRASAIEVELEQQEGQLSRGEPVDLDKFARAASHLRRIHETLGIKRVPRDITPDLRAHLTAAAADAVSVAATTDDEERAGNGDTEHE
jgi:hypothetical protein